MSGPCTVWSRTPFESKYTYAPIVGDFARSFVPGCAELSYFTSVSRGSIILDSDQRLGEYANHRLPLHEIPMSEIGGRLSV